jgi:hypothetical protein
MFNPCAIPLQQFGMKPARSCCLQAQRSFTAACISAATGELIPISLIRHGLCKTRTERVESRELALEERTGRDYPCYRVAVVASRWNLDAVSAATSDKRIQQPDATGSGRAEQGRGVASKKTRTFHHLRRRVRSSSHAATNREASGRYGSAEDKPASRRRTDPPDHLPQVPTS